MQRFIVGEASSLKNFTDNTCPQASFCFRTLLKAREIRVNGKKVGENVPLAAGDEVCYFMTPAQESKKAYDILYEDRLLLVADKESGVNSEAVFCDLKKFGERYFIHRLDRNTAGLMLFAKTAEAAKALESAFRARRIEKIYHALVLGKMPARHAVEEARLVKDARASAVKIFPLAEKRADASLIRTEYEVLEERGDCTLLKIVLHTGKTHQIRAHMAFLGHPVAGDEKYGDEAYNRAHRLTRQKLLSKQLILHTDGVLAALNGRVFTSPREL